MNTDKNDQGSSEAGKTRLPFGSEAFPAVIAAIAESAAVIILAADMKGRISYANPHCVRMCAVAEDDLSNRTIFDIFDLTDHQKAAVSRAIKKRQPHNLTASFTGGADGKYPPAD